MSKKSIWIVILLAIFLTAGTVQADMIPVYDNGDFEDGLTGTGWRYDDYYEDSDSYDYSVYQPRVVNVSGIGGDVGVKFRRLKRETDGYNPVLTRIEGPILAGEYTYTVTFMGINMTGGNWLRANLYWVKDPRHPWRNYDLLEDIGTHSYYEDWVKLNEGDNGIWQTQVANFVVQDDDPFVGAYFSPWLQTENYNGGIIFGEASLVRHNSVPEPGTMLLLGAGILGLVGFRKRFKK